SLCTARYATACYPLSLHVALPIWIQDAAPERPPFGHREALGRSVFAHRPDREVHRPANRLQRFTGGVSPPDFLVERHPSLQAIRDRKSTRLNSSHSQISYAVFCLK